MATSGLLVPVTAETSKKEHDANLITILDVRSKDDYTSEHIERSIFGILLKNDPNQSKLVQVSNVIKKTNSILIVTNQGDEEITYKTQADNGFTQIRGYLEGGMNAWKNKVLYYN